MEAKVFVKIDQYRNVMDTIHSIKQKIKEAKDTLSKITDAKRKEDEEFADWNAKIAEVEERIEKIDNTLLEPESV